MESLIPPILKEPIDKIEEAIFKELKSFYEEFKRESGI